jgi:hypothetical protein
MWLCSENAKAKNSKRNFSSHIDREKVKRKTTERWRDKIEENKNV